MSKNATSCSRVSDGISCPRCKEKRVIKNGKTKNDKQQYFCKICGYRFIENYTCQAYNSDINHNIIQLTKEGLGIKSTARVLKISATTLLKRIVSIAKSIQQPIISKGKTYEVDEMCKYCRNFARKATPFAAANTPPEEGNFSTNHIERQNLTLGTHIKRLNRRTICFSKSLMVLVSVLKIYFWS